MSRPEVSPSSSASAASNASAGPFDSSSPDTPPASQQIPVSHANPSRKKQFRTFSHVLEEKGKRYFIKQAASEEAFPFLQSIITKEAVAAEHFPEKVQVVRGTLNGNALRYEFHDQPTLERLMEESLLAGEFREADRILDEYLDFLNSLPVQHRIPQEFLDHFTITDPSVRIAVPCLAFSPIDCIPHNIMVSDNHWLLLDHEWTFRFPMPRDLLVHRAISSLVYRLQVPIRQAVAQSNPLTLYCGYGSSKYFIPESWLQRVLATSLSPKQAMIIEEGIARFVEINPPRYRNRIRRNRKLLCHPDEIESYSDQIVSRLITLVKKLLYFHK